MKVYWERKRRKKKDKGTDHADASSDSEVMWLSYSAAGCTKEQINQLHQSIFWGCGTHQLKAGFGAEGQCLWITFTNHLCPGGSCPTQLQRQAETVTFPHFSLEKSLVSYCGGKKLVWKTSQAPHAPATGVTAVLQIQTHKDFPLRQLHRAWNTEFSASLSITKVRSGWRQRVKLLSCSRYFPLKKPHIRGLYLSDCEFRLLLC